MELDTTATSDLTEFFTKRFPTAEDREALARAARISFSEPSAAEPDIAWGGLVTRAREQSALPRLAQCAARRRPEDENLQGVAAVLNGRVWPPHPAAHRSAGWKQLGALCALVGVASVAWAASGPTESTTSAAPELVEASAKTMEGSSANATTATTGSVTNQAAAKEPATNEPTLGAAAPEDPTPDATATATATASDNAGASPEGGSDQPPEANPASTPPAAAPAAAGPAPEKQVFIGCKGEPGTLVGYWYAGRESPGQKGDEITVPRDLNVRADYPDSHNDYNRRAEIRCTLGVGQSLVLTADPIRVPGDAYWVPLHATRRR